MTHRRVRGALAGAKRRLPPGTSPGTIRVDPASPAPIITAIAYGPEGDVVERRVAAGELAALKGSAPILWVNIEGLGDAEAIREIGRVFGLHPLALEDAVNVHQRPKVDAFAGNLFIVARMADEAEGRLCTEQLGLFLGEGFVLTFQERRGDCFDPVRNRLRLAGPIRAKGADYLAYALLDAVVDNWFPALDKCEERIDVLDRVRRSARSTTCAPTWSSPAARSGRCATRWPRWCATSTRWCGRTRGSTCATARTTSCS